MKIKHNKLMSDRARQKKENKQINCMSSCAFLILRITVSVMNTEIHIARFTLKNFYLFFQFNIYLFRCFVSPPRSRWIDFYIL